MGGTQCSGSHMLQGFRRGLQAARRMSIQSTHTQKTATNTCRGSHQRTQMFPSNQHTRTMSIQEPPAHRGVSASVHSGNLVCGGNSHSVHSKHGVTPGRMTRAWPLKPSVPPSTIGLMVSILGDPSSSNSVVGSGSSRACTSITTLVLRCAHCSRMLSRLGCCDAPWSRIPSQAKPKCTVSRAVSGLLLESKGRDDERPQRRGCASYSVPTLHHQPPHSCSRFLAVLAHTGPQAQLQPADLKSARWHAA